MYSEGVEIMKKVFLGGTCNGSTWRDELIEMLEIDYFNPVVDNWTEECYQEELRQREICDYCLYVITPKMTGVYSIAEAVDDSNKRPKKTVFCILDSDVSCHELYTVDGIKIRKYAEGFDAGQLKSLIKVGLMVEKNGGKFFRTLNDVAEFLNNN